MIFVTIGSSKFGFDRLLKIIDQAVASGQINDKVFAQIGSSQYIPQHFEYTDFMPFDKMIEIVQETDIIVSHAGVGSTILCLSYGKVPIVFPRLCRLGEVVDDHQIEFTDQMVKLGKILAAHDSDSLLDRINNYQILVAELSDNDHSTGKNDLTQYLDSILNS